MGSFSNKFIFFETPYESQHPFLQMSLDLFLSHWYYILRILLFIIAIVQCSLGQGKQFSSLNQSLFAGMAQCGCTHRFHFQIRVTAEVCFRPSHRLWLLLWLLLWHFALKKPWLDILLRNILNVSFFFKFNTILNINPTIIVMWNY